MKYTLVNSEKFRLIKNGEEIDVFGDIKNRYTKSEVDDLLSDIGDSISGINDDIEEINDSISDINNSMTFQLEDFLIMLYLREYPELAYLGIQASPDNTGGLRVKFNYTEDEEDQGRLYYSLDDRQTWTKLEDDTYTPEIAAGNKIYFKGELVASEEEIHPGIGYFSTNDQDCIVFGNIMSLLFGDNAFMQTNLSDHYKPFYGLFSPVTHAVSNGHMQVIDASGLLLPATTLSNYCYGYMFNGCQQLRYSPKLLPATILSTHCYAFMFNGCDSLETAPNLPATTLARYCYMNMFKDCISLTTAPVLPAATLVQNCYNNMFSGCSTLNYIKALFSTTPGASYTNSWVDSVSASGTFVYSSKITWSIDSNRGVNGVPSDWTVMSDVEESDSNND